MATLAFSFGGATRDRLSFHFPLTYVPGSPRERNPRYAVSNRPSGIGLLRGSRGVWYPPEPWSGIGTLRGTRYVVSNRPSGIGLLRNPRYSWVPAESWSGIGILRGPRHHQPGIPFPSYARRRNVRSVSPPTPFVGEIPPENVRANVTVTSMTNGTSLDQAERFPWQGAAEAMALHRIPLAPSADLAAETQSPFGVTEPIGPTVRIELKPSDLATSTFRSPLGRAVLEVQRIQPVWRDSTPFDVSWRIPFYCALLLTQTHRLPWREAMTRGQTWRHSASDAQVMPTLLAWRFPWQDSRVLAGFSWPWTMPLPPPIIPPRANLRFHFHPPLRPRLQFRFGREPSWILPLQRSYVMHHTVSVVRLPDRLEIPVSSLSISMSHDEWCWSIQMNLLGEDAVDRVRPVVYEALEIEVGIDGYVWQFRLDQVSGSSSFVSFSGSTQGRSRSALLGPDVALPSNGYEPDEKTAQQLCEQELILTGWQLNWDTNFPTWLVPAKRFSYSMKTPIEAIVQVVEVAGGRVYTHPSEDWLFVKPQYPVPVWQWTSVEPDVILPQALMKTLSWKPRIGTPYDAIFLGDGIDTLAKVVRAGLPGASIPDQPTVEPLLCHLDACRERGKTFLCEAVAGVDFTIELPLSSISGACPLRQVGELVRFAEGGKNWVGMVMQLNVSATWPVITQQLDIRAIEVPA